MRKHTTMNLDPELVAGAAAILGTRHTVDTVHASLREVIRAERRARLLRLTSDLDLADLEAIRSSRFVTPAE